MKCPSAYIPPITAHKFNKNTVVELNLGPMRTLTPPIW